MTKDNSANNITDKFKDSDGKQYFLISKRNKTGYKNILPEDLQYKEIIRGKDNIVLPLVIDTEYTSYIGNLEKMNIQYLETPQNRQIFQLKTIDAKIKKTGGFANLNEAITLKNKDVVSISQNDEWSNIKQIPTLHLSTQIKHIFYDDSTILLNPKIKTFYESNITDSEYLYPYYDKNSQAHIFNYLKLKGFDVGLEKIHTDFKKHVKENNYKTCTLKLYAYFLLADLPKIFQNSFLNDLLEAMRSNLIKQDKRLAVNGKCNSWYPNWLITINGEIFRLAIDLIDVGAIQGNISFNNVLENLNISTDDKNLLDDLKENMLLAMVKKPKEFKRYAIGDLSVYEALKKHNDLFVKSYKDLGLEDYIVESKLTTGSTVNDLQTAVLLKHLGLKDRSKNNLKILNNLTKPASPRNLRSYINAHEKIKNGSCLKRQVLSKTMGGRCHSNRTTTINVTSSMYSLCDIDISGAYTTTASVLNYYTGCPTILNFNPFKVTLREFLTYYEKKHLIKRGFKLVVETKKDNPFTVEQDLIPSWTDTRVKHQIVNESGTDQVISSIDLENTPTAIYTTELHNASISWDELDIIRTEMCAKQRNDILDKSYLKTAIFYPKNFQCNSVEELNNKIKEHEEKGTGRFKDNMSHSTIDNEDCGYSHFWYSTNFGELIINNIMQYRVQNKNTNVSLSYLYKLIGNTIYGINISRHFSNSNIVLGTNITSMARCGMWLIEKTVNIYQTITDGGIANLNEVLHLIRDRLDTSFLVRAYQYDNRHIKMYKKYAVKPITKDGKDIDYVSGKGWLIEGKYYGCDKDLLIQTKKEYKELKNQYNKNNPLLLEKERELSFLEGEIKNLYEKISSLYIDHVRKIFPNNDLFNGVFKKCKVDEKGIAFKDNEGGYIYEEVKGIFKLEVKTLCNSLGLHGSADYIYNNIEGKTITKMRGYEAKTNVVSWFLNNQNILEHDIDYYKEKTPIERFLSDLKNNPEKVPFPRPFTKTSLLKTAEYRKNYVKTWQHSNIFPSHDYYELVRIPIFTLRFKFKSHNQYKKWVSYCNSLKRRYNGLSFEIFYLNEDGTINYKKMMEEVDKHISNGVMNPKNIYDKSNNLFRDLKNLNIKKNQYLASYIKLIQELKNMMRITVIGLQQYVIENSKISKNGITLIIKKPIYADKTYYKSYENVNTYSENIAFRDHSLNSF